MDVRTWTTKALRWLTRAYRYEFEVIRSFAAVATISGIEREFKPGEMLTCDASLDGPAVTFEAEGVFFIVERPVFEVSCRARKPTTMPS